MKLEDTKLSEISQSQKDKYCMILFMWVPRTVKFIEIESGRVFARVQGERNMGSYCLRGIGFQFYCLRGIEFQFGKMKKVLEMDGSDGRTTM